MVIANHIELYCGTCGNDDEMVIVADRRLPDVDSLEHEITFQCSQCRKKVTLVYNVYQKEKHD